MIKLRVCVCVRVYKMQL